MAGGGRAGGAVRLRRGLLILGTLLLALPLLTGSIVRLLPFDFQVNTSSPLVASLLSPGLWMLLGGVLVLTARPWRKT